MISKNDSEQDGNERAILIPVNETLKYEKSYCELTKMVFKFFVPLQFSNLSLVFTESLAAQLLAQSGEDAITALNTIGPIKLIAGATSIAFFGIGVSSSQRYGQGRTHEIKSIVIDGVGLTVLLSGPVVAMFYTADKLAKHFNANENVQNIIWDYCKQYGAGYPMFYYFATVTQASLPWGTLPSSVALLLNTGVVCGLGYWLTKGGAGVEPLPIQGMGISSTVGAVLGGLGFSAYLRFAPTYKAIWKHAERFTWQERLHSCYANLKHILHVGVPAGVNNLCFAASTILASMIINKTLSDSDMQIQAININPAMFMQIFTSCSADVAAVICAEFYGAKSSVNIRKFFKVALASNVLAALTGTALVAALGKPYIHSFAPKFTSEEVDKAYKLMMITAGGQMATSVGGVAIGVLRGIDHTWQPMLINIIVKILSVFALSILLAKALDVGVYSTAISDLSVSAAIYMPLMLLYASRKISEEQLSAQFEQLSIEDGQQDYADRLSDADSECTIQSNEQGQGPLTWLFSRRRTSAQLDVSPESNSSFSCGIM